MTRSFGIILVCLAAASNASAGTLTASRTYSTSGVESIRINFGAGALDVEAAETDEIEVTMLARCSPGKRCEERARSLRLVSEREGNTLVFRLDGQKKTVPRMPKVTLRFRVPAESGVQVHMGAGAVDVAGMEGNVDVTLGAGDVEIRKAASSVRSVDVHVGVGDARLHAGARHVEGRGFVSKRLKWSEGTGVGRVDVDLGAGDVTVALD